GGDAGGGSRGAAAARGGRRAHRADDRGRGARADRCAAGRAEMGARHMMALDHHRARGHSGRDSGVHDLDATVRELGAVRGMDARAAGGQGLDAGLALGTGEVSRHAVRLVVVDAPPRLEWFTALPQLLRAGDLVVVNDAATLSGSLPGRTADGAVFELRLP